MHFVALHVATTGAALKDVNMDKNAKIAKVMREYKRGKLRSGSKSGPKVTSQKQALAIALSEANRRKGK